MARWLIPAAATAVCAAAAVALVSFDVLHRPPPASDAVQSFAGADIGGPFTLVNQNGRAVTQRDLLGRPTVMAFGYTFCPEVCPTTLADMSGWLKALGPEAGRMNFVFVSIDPGRDTPKQLKAYLSSFDPRIQGLTGTPAEVAAMAKAYRVYYQKEPLPGGGYSMDHTSMLYTFDAQGRFAGPIAYHSPSSQVLATLRQLVHA